MEKVKNIYESQILKRENIVVGDRIKDARIYRGLSQEELAKKIGVTKQAISKYETNKIVPTSDVIAKLPHVLEFPIKFFFTKQAKDEKKRSIVYFRSKSIPKKTTEQLSKILKFMDDEIMDFYSTYVQLPSINLPDLSNFIENEKCNYTRNDIIDISEQIRKHWNLGLNPIPNLAYILQMNGFLISKIFINQNKTDGFSQWIDKRGYIITSSNKESAVRTRFDYAHELGHLILHATVSIDEQGGKTIEREADFFASEFLYPSKSFINDIQGMPITLENMLILKEKWKISIQAIVRKCLDLNIISDDKYTYFQKRISYKGWRTNEPLDNVLKVEEPRLLMDATELLLENNIIQKQDILEGICMNKDDIISLCNLPKNYFDLQLSNLIQLFQ